MLRTLIRWGAGLLGLVVLALGVVIAIAWWRSSAALDQVYAQVEHRVDWSGGDVARGEYLAHTRGCAECHGENLAGRVMVDAPPFGQLVGTNLTPAGLGADYYQQHLVGVLRGGIGADGRSLVFMPSMDYMRMADSEVADLAAYLAQLPAISTPQLPSTNPGLLPRLLWLFGGFPLVAREHMDLSLQPPASVVVEASVEYGEHVTAVCKGCHGMGLAGHNSSLEPGTPKPANLTPGGPMADWSESDFFTALRQGKRPDGTAIDEFMPWRVLSNMTDVEIRAMWLYLHSMPARAHGDND